MEGSILNLKRNKYIRKYFGKNEDFLFDFVMYQVQDDGIIRLYFEYYWCYYEEFVNYYTVIRFLIS